VEYFDTEEAAFIVLEFIEGTDLCSLYESRDLEPLPEPEVKKIFKQLVDAVAYIHLKGVVHLDLKLENVLLDKQNRVS
jgi:serine/threonine protein kinase